MRKLVLFMHASLDGFVGGTNGEMDWIRADETMFDYAAQCTEESDIALYGRITYEMMDGYWPTAADQPNATSSFSSPCAMSATAVPSVYPDADAFKISAPVGIFLISN